MAHLWILFLIFMGGCRSLQVSEGRIPAEHVREVKKLQGRYSGVFSGRKAEISFFVRGDRPTVKYSDTFSSDLLGEGCHSKVGPLKNLIVDDGRSVATILLMEFEFNPSECPSLVPLVLRVRPIKKNVFEVSLQESSGALDGAAQGVFSRYR